MPSGGIETAPATGKEVVELVDENKIDGRKSDGTTTAFATRVGLTFARFPDGVVKVATIKPGSAADKSDKFARGQVVYAINCGDDEQVVYDDGKEASTVDAKVLHSKMKEAANVKITVGPKPFRSTKFNDPHAVKEFRTFVGEFKGIEQFLEGIQGQIGLPFGNIERGMQMEVTSDDTPFGASNNAGDFTPKKEYDFVASDYLSREFKVPGFRDTGPQDAKERHFIPLKVFLYATCAKPLQALRQDSGTDAAGYGGEIPKEFKDFVLTVLLRRAREAVLTSADALKNAGTDWPKLKGLAEVANDKDGKAVLHKLRDVIHDALSSDAKLPNNPKYGNLHIDDKYGLPTFEDVAKFVVEKWAEVKVEVEPMSQATSDARDSKELPDSRPWPQIDKECLMELALLAREKLKRAGLTREEVIGLRLYTGPLFVKMNGALRAKDSGTGSTTKRYTNIIFAATSGMVKLSKVSPIPEGRLVFRGLSGIELPEEFWKNDTEGVRGGVEMAFLSTTTNMEVAIDYSNAGKDNMPFIFKIKVGAIDKGAALSFLSQFPEEDEILMPPRSFLEVEGPPERLEVPVGRNGLGSAQQRDQAVTVEDKRTDQPEGVEDKEYVWAIPVRINCNVQNFNIENFARARKDLILSSLDQAIMEVREELARMRTDTKYTQLAVRPDDLEFANAPQVQILGAVTNESKINSSGAGTNESKSNGAGSDSAGAGTNESKSNSAGAGTNESKSKSADATGASAAQESEHLPVEEEEDLPAFLKAHLQRHCVHKEAQDRTVSCEMSPASLDSSHSLPRLIVLVVSEDLSEDHQHVKYCKEMKEKGVVVVGVLAPKYRKPDADAWWPASMGFLHDCKHVDLRDQGVWADKCERELLPLVRTRAFLRRDKPQEYLLGRVKEEVDEIRQTFASEDPAWFNEDFNFRLATHEALNLYSTAMAKVNLYVEEPSRGLRWIVDLPQRTCHRLLVGKERRTLAEMHEKRYERESTDTALKLCKMTHAAKGRDGLESIGRAGDKTQMLFTWTPLMLHAADGNPELVRLLLAGKAQVDKQDDVKGYTALRLAAEYGCRSVVEVLLEHNASSLCVDKRGVTAFLVASENGHLEVLKLLYDKADRAALNRANDIKYTPLMAAVRQRHVETARWLLEQKADVSQQTTDSGHTALTIAAESRSEGVGMVDLLLKYNADPNQQTHSGSVPLTLAIVSKNVARVQSLLAAGADPDIEKIVKAQEERREQLSLHLDLKADSEAIQASSLANNAENLKTERPAAGEGTPPKDIKLLEQVVVRLRSEDTDEASRSEMTEALLDITKALRAAMLKQKSLAEWTTEEVKVLLRGFGESFEEAVGVVEHYQMKGEDLLELVQIPGTERNPLHLLPSEGGLGLTEIQVRMLKRELRKRGLVVSGTEDSRLAQAADATASAQQHAV